MASGFNSKTASASSTKAGHSSSLLALLRLEAAETPRQRSMRHLLEAMHRSKDFAQLVQKGFAVEDRVLEKLSSSGPIGEDHASLIRLMSLSLVSGLLDEKALAECRKEKFFEPWLDGSRARVAWSVAVGGGKTLCAASLCREVADALARDPEALQPQSRGVLYSASSLALLVNMKKALVEMGVPNGTVGVFHSNPKARVDLPSVKASELGRYPVVLCTQQMLQSASARYETKHREPKQVVTGTDLEDLLLFKGKDRLTIWDEAFQSSLAESASLSALAMGLGSLRECVARLDAGGVIELQEPVETQSEARLLTKDSGDALVQLVDGLCRQAELAAAAIEPGKPASIVLPSIDELQRDQMTKVGAWLRDAKAPGPAEAIEAIAEMSATGGLEVSLLKGGPKTMAIVRPRVVISDRLRRLVVLDAGYVTSTISQMDPTLHLAAGADYAGKKLQPKQFSKVAVKFYCGHSGRGREHEGTGLVNTRTRSILIRDQVERIARVPLGEKSLVITFARRGSGIDFKGEIETELERSCPGWSDHINGNNRVTVITWGEHVGMNDWRDCKHLFFVGVLRRNWAGDLMGKAWATSRGDISTFGMASPLQVEANQAAQEIMQAIGRGNARATINGQAGEMTVHIPYKESLPRYAGMAPCPGSPLWEELARMLPGCSMHSESRPPKASGAEQVEQAAALALDELAVDQITSAKLKPMVMAHLPAGGAGISDDVFKAGLKALADANATRAAAGELCWVKPSPSSRSWVRITPSPAPDPGKA